MSLVTTPSRTSSASAAHSAATSVLLPVPTGPAIPILKALAGKEPPRVAVVPLGGQVEPRRGRRRQGSEHGERGGLGGPRVDVEPGEPGGGLGRVDRHQ